MNEMNDDRGRELDELKTKLMKENHFLKSLARDQSHKTFLPLVTNFRNKLEYLSPASFSSLV